MSPDLVLWKLSTASVLIGTGTNSWNPGDLSAEDSPERSFTSEVFFAVPFARIPVVHLALNGSDLEQNSSAPLLLRAEQIMAHGLVARLTASGSIRV